MFQLIPPNLFRLEQALLRHRAVGLFLAHDGQGPAESRVKWRFTWHEGDGRF